ncbi:MAG: ABC transporter substrate-binding protein [Spirochaetes bacterium]|nr:ABC transporter substrate-binding protein [Spirochaetota bacterium]
MRGIKRAGILMLAVVLMFAFSTSVLFAKGTQEKQKAAAGKKEAAPAGKVVVNYWSRKTGSDGDVFSEFIKGFNTANPNIEVKMQVLPWGEYYGKVRASILTGNAPEVFDVSVYSPPMFLKYVESFTKEDFTKAGINMADYAASAWEAVKFNGKYYGFPDGIVPLGFYYNPVLFKAAGLNPSTPPKNLKEFVEQGKKLTKDTNGDGKINQWSIIMTDNNMMRTWFWESILDQNGKSLLNADKTKANFNNKAGLDAINVFLDMSRKYGIAPKVPGNSGNAFITKLAAMDFDGVWTRKMFKDKITFATAPMPQLGSVKPAIWSSMDIFLFPKGYRTKNPAKWEATMSFAKWVMSKKFQLEYTKAAGQLASRLDALNDPELRADPHVNGFLEEVSSGMVVYAPALKTTQEIYGVISESLAAVFAGKLSAEKALAQSEKQVNQILARK